MPYYAGPQGPGRLNSGAISAAKAGRQDRKNGGPAEYNRRNPAARFPPRLLTHRARSQRARPGRQAVLRAVQRVSASTHRVARRAFAAGFGRTALITGTAATTGPAAPDDHIPGRQAA
jgi:hypothetical protein